MPPISETNLFGAWATNFRELWKKFKSSHATAYELRHYYAIENINRWIDEGFGFDAKLLYLSKRMGHKTLESTKYYYSLVPKVDYEESDE